MILVQLLVVGGIATALIIYLFKSLSTGRRIESGSHSVLISGCDSGIGHSLAIHLSNLGLKVFAGCLQPHGEGANLLRLHDEKNIKILSLDVTSQESVDRAMQSVKDNTSSTEHGLWAVINNAGICVCGEFEWLTWEHCESMININLLGAARLTKAALPVIKANKGRVIVMSSVAGLRGYPGLSMYCATKHGLEGFSDSLRQELSRHDVHVISVQPGDFSTSTCILHNHHKNMNHMWDKMTSEAREENHPYFKAYHETVAKVGIPSRKQLDSLPTSLMAGIEDAILSVKPRNRYLLTPNVKSHLKLLLWRHLPHGCAERLVAFTYKKRMNKVLSV